MASSKNGSTASPQAPVDSGRNNYKISIQVSATPSGDDDTEVYYKVSSKCHFMTSCLRIHLSFTSHSPLSTCRMSNRQTTSTDEKRESFFSATAAQVSSSLRFDAFNPLSYLVISLYSRKHVLQGASHPYRAMIQPSQFSCTLSGKQIHSIYYRREF